MRVFKFDRQPVQCGDCLDEREAEAAAGSGAAAVEAIETVEDALTLSFGDAGAVVGYLDVEAGISIFHAACTMLTLVAFVVFLLLL